MIDTAPMNDAMWNVILKPIDERAKGLTLSTKTIMGLSKYMDELRKSQSKTTFKKEIDKILELEGSNE